jgi:hypothetical protein
MNLKVFVFDLQKHFILVLALYRAMVAQGVN